MREVSGAAFTTSQFPSRGFLTLEFGVQVPATPKSVSYICLGLNLDLVYDHVTNEPSDYFQLWDLAMNSLFESQSEDGDTMVDFGWIKITGLTLPYSLII